MLGGWGNLPGVLLLAQAVAEHCALNWDSVHASVSFPETLTVAAGRLDLVHEVLVLSAEVIIHHEGIIGQAARGA